MNRTKPIRGECQHCGGHLSFPADQIGLKAACPHCGQQTELLLATPRPEPVIPRRALIWAAVAAAVLGFGLIASFIALKRAENLAARHKQAAPATPATNSQP